MNFKKPEQLTIFGPDVVKYVAITRQSCGKHEVLATCGMTRFLTHLILEIVAVLKMTFIGLGLGFAKKRGI